MLRFEPNGTRTVWIYRNERMAGMFYQCSVKRNLWNLLMTEQYFTSAELRTIADELDDLNRAGAHLEFSSRFAKRQSEKAI